MSRLFINLCTACYTDHVYLYFITTLWVTVLYNSSWTCFSSQIMYLIRELRQRYFSKVSSWIARSGLALVRGNNLASYIKEINLLKQQIFCSHRLAHPNWTGIRIVTRIYLQPILVSPTRVWCQFLTLPSLLSISFRCRREERQARRRRQGQRHHRRHEREDEGQG